MGVGLAIVVQIVGFIIRLVAQRGESFPDFLKGFVVFNRGAFRGICGPGFQIRNQIIAPFPGHFCQWFRGNCWSLYLQFWAGIVMSILYATARSGIKHCRKDFVNRCPNLSSAAGRFWYADAKAKPDVSRLSTSRPNLD